MLDPNFVFIGLIFNIIGASSYLIDTIKGKVKPNRVTWFLWAVIPMIAFIAELKQGVGLVSLMTFIVGFNPLMIFLASFVNKNALWKIGKLDIWCGVFSLLGVLLWGITKNGNIAILFSILADLLAAVPTIIKSYYQPETENYQAFFLWTLSAGITLLTVKIWSIAYYGFPLYIFIMNSLLTVLIKLKLGKTSESRKNIIQ